MWWQDNYETLLLAAKEADLQFSTVQNFVRAPCDNVVVLRHDIDRFPNNALRMARLEANNGIQSTYYVRMVDGVFSKDLVRELSVLGHEVGYHFETLVKSKGDRAKARDIFKSELEILRQSCEIKTVAAHGSPLSKFDSKAILGEDFLVECNLEGDAYMSIDFDSVAYYTDTGRTWNGQDYNVRDRVHSQTAWPTLNTLEDLIDLVCSKQLARICIQTHPERWAYSRVTYVRSLFFDVLANRAKKIVKKIV